MKNKLVCLEWLYFLKNEKIEDSFTAPGLRKTTKVLSTSKRSDDEYRAYESYIDYMRRKAGIDDASYDDGMEKGLEKGILIGEERSEEKLQLKTMEIAQEMNRKGMDVETIADCTGLTVNEVKALRESKP